MNTIFINNTALSEPIAIDVWVKDRMIYVHLTNGRIIGFPASRFKILKEAIDEQLNKIEICLNGYALR